MEAPQPQSEMTFKLPDDTKELKYLMGLYYFIMWCAGVGILIFGRSIFTAPIFGVLVLTPYVALMYIHWFITPPLIKESWRRIKEERDKNQGGNHGIPI